MLNQWSGFRGFGWCFPQFKHVFLKLWDLPAPRFQTEIQSMKRDLGLSPITPAQEVHDRCRAGIPVWTTTDASRLTLIEAASSMYYYCANFFCREDHQNSCLALSCFSRSCKVLLSRWFAWDAGWQSFSPYWTFVKKVHAYRQRLQGTLAVF